MATDAWEPFQRLQERIKETVAPLGLEIVTWAILPGQRGEPNGCQVVFSIKDEAFQSPEERETDKMFEEMLIQEKLREAEAQRQKIVEENLKVSRKGIFPEKNDTPEA